MTDALRELARYDAMRQRSRELHEEHRAAVLTGSGRQHHDEATDAIVVEALLEAGALIRRQRVDGCPSCGRPCPSCRALDRALGKIAAALKALGK